MIFAIVVALVIFVAGYSWVNRKILEDKYKDVIGRVVMDSFPVNEYSDDSRGRLNKKINESAIVNYFAGKVKNRSQIEELLNLSKNPYNLTPTSLSVIIWGLRLVVSPLIFVVMYGLTKNVFIALLSGLLPILLTVVMMSKMKSIIRSRERDWDSIYQHMWYLKVLNEEYGGELCCVEMAEYLKQLSYENNKELVEGFYDFYRTWDNSVDTVPDFVYVYYNFTSAISIYSILKESDNSGVNDDLMFDSTSDILKEKASNNAKLTLKTVEEKGIMYAIPAVFVMVAISLFIPAINLLSEAL